MRCLVFVCMVVIIVTGASVSRAESKPRPKAQVVEPTARQELSGKVEVRVNNPDFELRPNTFGEVTFEVETHADALVIPQKAVLENKFVFLAEGEVAERRDITLGLQNTDLVEVLSGLEEGDLIVVEGNYGLEDGAKIDIEEVIK